MVMNIKDLVKDKNVEFLYFREGNFIYRTEDGFEFPVPLSDIGSATLMANDKAIYFMRYIRKHIELTNNTEGNVISNVIGE